MHRVVAPLARSVALVVGLAGCGGGGGSGPDDLVIAQIVFELTGSSGPPLPTNVFRFRLSASLDAAGTSVFEAVGVTPADQGRTFAIRPADDPEFAALATILTDGVDDALALDALNDLGSVGEGDVESNYVVGLDAGFTGPDMTGFTITQIRLVIDQFSITPVAGQTNFQFSVRYVFLGTRP